jgi:hypothetical protein
MNGQKIELCGMCYRQIGQGKGKLTGMRIDNFRTVLDDPQVPQLLGLPIKVSIKMCIECVTTIADTLHTAHKRQVLTTKVN